MKEPDPITPEPFDYEALRLTEGGETVLVKKVVGRVPIKNPHRQDWFKVKTGEEWTFPVKILRIKKDDEWYLVVPAIAGALGDDLTPFRLYTAYTRDGDYFLIAVTLPVNGVWNPWHESLQKAVNAAQEGWTKAVANKGNGGYDLFLGSGDIPEPSLPDSITSIMDLIKIAFQGKIIENLDHPIVRRVQGKK